MSDIFEDPTLANPDADPDAKYSWDEEFQRHIAALLISDRQFLLQSLDLVKPSYFTNKAHTKVCGIAFDFFKKYRILPRKEFLIQELKGQLKEDKGLPFFIGEVNTLFDYFQPGMEARDYLRDKIIYFAKIQSVKHAFHKSLELIDKAPESEETWEKIYDKMRDAMTTHQNFDIGTDYFKSMKDRYVKKDEDSTERFITGFNSIDLEINGGGFRRGQMLSVVAQSGVGKSVWLANFSSTNLLRGKKGVYFTLEIPEVMVAERMDAILTGFPIQNLMAHKDDIFEKLNTLNIERPAGDDAIWPMVVKKFPGGTATVNTIRAYIAQLKFHGFSPDFVIVDYIGEMQDHPDMKIHESRERIVKELHGMAEEEDFFLATAMQPNRDGKKDNKGDRGRLDDDHLADSFGQIRPLDCCLSLNQNDNEKLLGVGRAYVIKQRDGKSRYQFYLKFDKENLRITETSRNEYMEIMNAQKEYASEETKIDLVVNKGWSPSDENADDKKSE
jgi:KaiC/GvpD/RAD55 family RecA-like ATPase